MSKKRWDIFCKIVDNFGDIGVCWRLARQLQSEHAIDVRLWVDDLQVAQRLMPALDTTLITQQVEGVHISHWHPQAVFSDAVDVVIEAFACGLPDLYQSKMQAQQTRWVNLEYLSAESWVESFHAQSSPQTNGLMRHFYFPGFTTGTGGLIRESDLAPPTTNTARADKACQVSLFCYPHAPIRHLLHAMAMGNQAIHCYVPATTILPQIADFLGRGDLQVGQIGQQGALTVEVLPFLSQMDYDHLLANCDINFVRGEDSWVRAIWAGKPFVWQPYQQEDAAHLPKLNAFLTQYYQTMPASQRKVVDAMHLAWIDSSFQPVVWERYISSWTAIALATQQASQALYQQPDLASKLVIFCNNL